MAPPVMADLGTVSTVAGVAYHIKKLGDEVSGLFKHCERLGQGMEELRSHIEERIRDCQRADTASPRIYESLSSLQHQIDEMLSRNKKIMKNRRRHLPNMQVVLRQQRDELFEKISALEADFSRVFRSFVVDEIAQIGIRQTQQAHSTRELMEKMNEVLFHIRSGMGPSPTAVAQAAPDSLAVGSPQAATNLTFTRTTVRLVPSGGQMSLQDPPALSCTSAPARIDPLRFTTVPFQQAGIVPYDQQSASVRPSSRVVGPQHGSGSPGTVIVQGATAIPALTSARDIRCSRDATSSGYSAPPPPYTPQPVSHSQASHSYGPILVIAQASNFPTNPEKVAKSVAISSASKEAARECSKNSVDGGESKQATRKCGDEAADTRAARPPEILTIEPDQPPLNKDGNRRDSENSIARKPNKLVARRKINSPGTGFNGDQPGVASNKLRAKARIIPTNSACR